MEQPGREMGRRDEEMEERPDEKSFSVDEMAEPAGEMKEQKGEMLKTSGFLRYCDEAGVSPRYCFTKCVNHNFKVTLSGYRIMN